MTVVNVTINGQPIRAPAGSTVLTAAKGAGIDIPTLCDHPALKPIGACRVCLVEVKGQRVLQPACTFPVSEGMEVLTESPAVVQSRRFVLDLLFAERNHYCMFCEMSGDCELQDLGYRYGLDHWVYPTYTRGFGVDASREAFLMDHNRCVLCRRCIRACAELVANHTLGLRERGAKTMICADMDVPFGESSCVSCGTCLQVCPTGALVDKRSAYMGRRLQTDRTRSTCAQCSVGCGMEVITRGGGVLRLEGAWDAVPNRGLLCRRGRFDVLSDRRQRVLRPQVRRNGVLVDVDWETALRAVEQRVRGTPPERLGVLASPQATNEALYLLGSLFGNELGCRNLGLLGGTLPLLLTPQATFEDLAAADLVLVVGADPVAEQPVASFLIKRTVDSGARLVLVNDGATGLVPFADMVLDASGIGMAVDVASRAQQPVVIYGQKLTPQVALALQRLERAAFIGMEPGANSRAARAFGFGNRLNPAALAAALVLECEQEFAGGCAPDLAADTCVISVSSYVSAWTERASVVLPMAIWSERAGTLTNCEGRVGQASQVLQPSGEAKADWEIMSLLSARLGMQVPSTLEQLTALAKKGLSISEDGL